MSQRKDKAVKRILMIGNGALFQLFNAFSTAIVAYFVLAKESIAIWGQFAAIWMMISILTLTFSFGNKDFLLKEFSKSNFNSKMLSNYNMSLRLPLLFVGIVFLLPFQPLSQSSILIPLLIASFIVNSFLPLLIYEKRFKLLLTSEIVAIALQLLYIFNLIDELDLVNLLISFLIYNIVKLLPVFIVFRNYVWPQWHYMLKLNLLKPLWPFFLLALGGMLVNKSDFMIVATFLSDASKAQYQIISTFISIGIISAHGVLQPFIKQIYRMNNISLNKLAFNYFLVGCALSLFYVLAVYIVISYFFHFQLSIGSVSLLYFIELIFFAINPLVFYIFRNDRQHHFVIIVLISGFLSLLFAITLVKPFGIEGALTANFMGNALMLFLLILAKKKITSPELQS